MGSLVLAGMTIPFLKEGEVLASYRTAMRPNNSHAFLNACFRATVRGGTITAASLALGLADKKARRGA